MDKMKVYFDISWNSVSVKRVVSALAKYLPAGLEISDADSADLIVLHQRGRHDHMTVESRKIFYSDKQYAVIVHALRNTRNPDPEDWMELWNDAKVVWAYEDLRPWIPNLYLAPFGADPTVFYKEDAEKKYLVGTESNSFKDECIGEVRLAAFKAQGNSVHFGTTFGEDPIVTNLGEVTDDSVLRKTYNQCQWFSALRHHNGFEMIAVESLLCGTRPIMFDTQNYRQWFDGLAEFIPEESVSMTSYYLYKVFKQESKPVSVAEIIETQKRFDWKRLVKGFWEQCLN